MIRIDRKQFMRGCAAVLGTSITGKAGATSHAGSARSALPGLPSQGELWRWIERINAFGPRLTGSPAQAAAVDFLARELAGMGLTVQRDTRTLQRWAPGRTALSLSDGMIVPVAAPYPYSGRTTPDGRTGEMIWFDGVPLSFHAARGRIAVVSVRRRDLTATMVDLLMERKARLPDATADFADPETTPLLTGLLGVPIEKAREAGVLGVVCVFEGVSDEQLAAQVLPFTTPYRDIPALWVSARSGAVLKAAVAMGRSARLVLEATLGEAATDTVYAHLPGREPGETIIVNTHTDGPNACEENGAAGVLALARYFSRLPLGARNRSLVFVLVTGHFQIPQLGRDGNQATASWLAAHRDLWDGEDGHAKAVAGVTIEHLGCTEWKDDLAAGRPAPTGRLELDLVYTANATLDRVYAEATRGRTKLRAVTLTPTVEQTMLGEGQPLYAAGIPVIASCALPDYLCQVLPGGGLARLDPDYAHQQVATFARCVAAIDGMSTEAIGGIPFRLTTPLSKLIALFRRDR